MHQFVRKVPSKTAVDWYNIIWDVCAQYFVDHPAVIRGRSIEVEIDESKLGHRKYHRFRMVDGHRVFGGTKRITGNSFLVEVQQRDANTLNALWCGPSNFFLHVNSGK